MPVDPAFAELLSDPRMALREPPAHIGIDMLRLAANAFLGAPRGPDIYRVEDITMPGQGGSIPVRLYRPSRAANLPLILFIHGGGFIFGSIDTHDALCRSLALHSDAIVASVGYRLVPEARFPDPVNDCVTALLGLATDGAMIGFDTNRIAIVGDSAGGQLAIATALSVAEIISPLRHLGLLYPVVDPSCSSSSAMEFADGFMLTRSFMNWCWGLYGSQDSDHSNPLFDTASADPRRLPPTTIVTAEFDPLRDEGEALAARLSEAGQNVTLHRFHGMIHGFAGLPQLTPRADEAIEEIARACASALAAPKNYVENMGK